MTSMPQEEECEFRIETSISEHGPVVSLAAVTDEGRISCVTFFPEDAVMVARRLMKASWEATKL